MVWSTIGRDAIPEFLVDDAGELMCDPERDAGMGIDAVHHP